MQANSLPQWTALAPYELRFGADLRQEEVQREVIMVIRKEEPDLVVLEPPCTPWSPIQLLNDPKMVSKLQEEDYPLWLFNREVWNEQDGAGRLVLSEHPFRSTARQ